MTDLTENNITKDNIIEMLDKIDSFVSDNNLALFLKKNRFGIKVDPKIRRYVDELEEEQPKKSRIFQLFLSSINRGINYIVNDNPTAEIEDVTKELKKDKRDEEDKEDSDYQTLDLHSYGNYKGMSLRDHVYNQLARNILEIIENNYGNLDKALKLIEKENYILESINHEFKTYREPNNVQKIDMYAARLIFEVESLETEKFEFEVTYDQLKIMINELSQIKDEFKELRD